MGMRWVLAAAWLLACNGAFAQAQGSASAAVASPSAVAVPVSDTAAFDAVVAAKTAAYREALARYSVAQQAAPADAAVAVSRCRFINNFTDDEYGDWLESGTADYAACVEQLRSVWSRHPEAQVYLYEQNYDDDAIAQGEALLKPAAQWPVPLRRRLYAGLSIDYSNHEQPLRARRMALKAARLGHEGSVPLAVEELVAQKRQAEAEALLHTTPAATEGWRAAKRIEAALLLQDAGVARAELARHLQADLQVEPSLAARVHLRASDLAAARAALVDTDSDDEDIRKVRFDTALAGSDLPLAAAQVVITDADNIGANLGRFATLATQWPRALLSGHMLLVLLALGAVLIVIALMPGLLLVPVHYRGLVRRMAGRPGQVLLAGVGLRHAWWGMAVVLCIPMVVSGIVEPGSMATLFESGGDAGALPAAEALFRITLWGTLACLLLLLPTMVRIGRLPIAGNLAMLRETGWVLGAVAALWAVAFAVSAWHQWRAEDTTTAQTQMVDMLVNGRNSGAGMALSFLLIVLLVPVLEELVFRGLMLGGMARHISFGWSNLMQAMLFALVHDDAPRFLFYLTMGLLGGLLVRKTRSLAPAIALHMINNAIAFLLVAT